MQPKTILICLIGIGIILIGGFVVWNRDIPARPAACTMEAKLCPDGSAVGRSGPNCEFAQCPEVTVDSSWKTFTDEKLGVSFRYPESLNATYIYAYDWPPQVAVVNGPFECFTAGSASGRAGRTELRMVDNRAYCVTKEVGAAAGSTYAQYAYAVDRGNKVLIFTESLQIPQCANYPDPQRTACEQEQATFDFDSVMDRIIRTTTVR